MNWVCIYRSKWIHKVEIVQAVLAENNINGVVVNKQDSSYLFGEIELHVHTGEVMLAIQIINDNKL